VELKLVQVEDELFRLYNENNERVVSFFVEIDKETALISYETKESFRNQGYASKGLILLKDALFNNNSILFLKLINLTGDYSRKVAENAGFFSRTNNLNYYVCLNLHAVEIINDKLSRLDISSVEYKNTQELLKKANAWRRSENKAKQKLQDKLNYLLEVLEIEEPGDYKDWIKSEISHLEKILAGLQDIEKKIR